MTWSRGKVWLILLCVQLALISGSVSFNIVHMPATYGSAALSPHGGAALQRNIWHAFVTRNTRSDASIMPIICTRVLVPAAVAGLASAGNLSWDHSFSLLRLASMFAAYAVFFWYLSRLLSGSYALVGLLFVGATISLTISCGPYEIPTDFPELFFYSLGLICILERRDALLCLVVLVATLNRETACFLPFILFCVRWSWPPTRRTLTAVAAAALCWLVPFVALRYWWMPLGRPHYGDSVSHNIAGLLHFVENLNPFNNYLFYLYLFGVAYALPFAYWSAQPPAIRRVLLSTPPILAVYLVVGYMNEPREIIVLYPLLVPGGLFALRAMLAEVPPLPT